MQYRSKALKYPAMNRSISKFAQTHFFKEERLAFLSEMVVLNAGLDALLIFGVDPWIPPLGLKGAAWASIISQGLFCLSLLFLFLSPSNRQLYASNQWYFNLVCSGVIYLQLFQELWGA